MTKIAVLGAGAGGLAAVAELSKAGFTCTLWNRGADAISAIIQTGSFKTTGIWGATTVTPACVTLDLRQALEGADVALVVLPTLAHADIARRLAEVDWQKPVILNPGHTGGALEFRAVWQATGKALPPIAEFSTLTYVARKPDAATVNVTGRAKSVRVAGLAKGQAAVELAKALYPGVDEVPDVIASSLCNVNLVLHPPGAVLCAGWVEATHGNFTFYREGMTSGVARVMLLFDDERRRVAAAFGHHIPSLVEEMVRIGTVEPGDANKPLRDAISAGEANARIKAPDSFQHRYYLEDFGHGVLPFTALAAIAGIEVPTAASLLNLGRVLVGDELINKGRTAAAMGIAGMSLDHLKRSVAA